jgi:hypothetical protein
MIKGYSDGYFICQYYLFVFNGTQTYVYDLRKDDITLKHKDLNYDI